MRSLLLLSLVSLLLVTLTSADHAAYQTAYDKMNADLSNGVDHSSFQTYAVMRALMSKASRSHHSFVAQQTNTTSEACRAASEEFSQKYTTCTEPTPSLNVEPRTSAQTAAAWEAWKSTCSYARTKDFEPVATTCKDSFADYNNIVIGLRLLLHFADARGTDGQFCAVSWNSISHFTACGDANATLCTGTLGESCEAVNVVTTRTSNTGVNAGGTEEPRIQTCQFQYGSTTALGRICNGCLGSFVTNNRDLGKSNPFLKSMGFFERMLCSKANNGNLCFNEIASLAGKDRLTQTDVDGICEDTQGKLSCYLGIASAVAQFNKNTALEALENCVKTYPNASQQITQCIPSYRNTHLSFKAARAGIRNLCTTNAAGQNCFLLGTNLHYDTQGCYNLARTQQSCSNCTSTLQTYVDNMGCCAGLFQEIESLEEQFTPEDLPQVDGLATAAELGITAPVQNCTVPTVIPEGFVATTFSGAGRLHDTANCGVAGLDSKLCLKCAESSKKIVKQLRVKIQWSKIQNDEALKEKIKLGLRTDVADNLGINIKDIVNDFIAEDSSVQVTVESTRRQAASSSTSNGIKYEFELGGATDTQVDANSQNFDRLQSEGTLTSTNTAAATSSCNCASTEDSLTVQENTSGAVGFTTVFALAVACALLL